MVEFKHKDEFKKWLDGKPRELAVILAVRAALRVSPLLQRPVEFKTKRAEENFLLTLFRSSALALAYGFSLDQEIAHAARTAATSIARAVTNDASRAVAHAAYATYVMHESDATNDAARTLAYAADACVRATILYSSVSDETAEMASWDEISIDATRLERSEKSQELIESYLWNEGQEPGWSYDFWDDLKSFLASKNNEHWHVWTDWWEDRRDGKPYNIEMEREIVLIPDEHWEQGPAHVNAMIAEIRARYAMQSLPHENRHGLPFAARNGKVGLRGTVIRDPETDADLFHAALTDDLDSLSRRLQDCGKVEDPYDRLLVSTEAMAGALGFAIGEAHPAKLWLGARRLREIERTDRRIQTEFGINEPPLDTEVGEALRTTLNTFTALCLHVPELNRLEKANRDNAEVVGISLDATQPILAMIRAENEAFMDEVREAFDGLMVDARSEIEGVAERGEAVTLASVENLIHRLIVEAIAEDRKDKPGVFWEAYKKKAGEHAADLTLGTLAFSVKGLIAYYFADLAGFTDKLPNADNYRDLLEKAIKGSGK